MSAKPIFCRKKKATEPPFLPKGYRFLRSEEFVHFTDWYWSPISRHYLPVNKKRVGERVSLVLSFIRKWENKNGQKS